MQGKKGQPKAKPNQLQIQLQQVQQQYSCCDAKLFKIPQAHKWIFTLCLIQVPTILHEILHLEWFSHNHLFAALYVLFCAQFINFWTFINLCLQDPGFIQKIKYGYEIDEQFVHIPKSQHINNYAVVSYIVAQRQMINRIKLCSTCNIYRPNRASHCNQCGVCIQRMDHHCPWIGTCVGKRNHKYFYIFLLSLMVLIITTAVMCIMIMVGTQEDPPNFGDRLKRYPFSIILIIIPCFPAFFFVGIMLSFHSYLLATDLTTKEVFDEKWSPIIGNPERKGNCVKNIIKLLIKAQQSKSKYKHQAFPYYNNQIQDSSMTGNQKNSQKNSDPENASKKKQAALNNSLSEQSIHKQGDSFRNEQQKEQNGHNNIRRTNQRVSQKRNEPAEIQTHDKFQIE